MRTRVVYLVLVFLLVLTTACSSSAIGPEESASVPPTAGAPEDSPQERPPGVAPSDENPPERQARDGETSLGGAEATFAETLLDLVFIPGGEFEMGDHHGLGGEDPKHASDELPLHTVYVDSFSMATTEVTNQQYVEYLNSALEQGSIEVRRGFVYGTGGNEIYCDTRESDPSSRLGWDGSTFTVLDNKGDHPVTGVRWYGAAAYTNWLSTQYGYEGCYNPSTWECDFSKGGFRLPTEAEWEYAALGGRDSYSIYPWGDDADSSKANWPNSGDPYETGPYPWTTPVGFYNGALHYKADSSWAGDRESYQTADGANGYGLYDMAGNVWEWCNDWYGRDYYSVSPYENPAGPDSGTPAPDGRTYHVLRGGNWYNGEQGHSRVSNRNLGYYRGPDDPDHSWYHVGFRVVLDDDSLADEGLAPVEPIEAHPEEPGQSDRTVGLILDSPAAFDGYTLFAPKHNTTTYLMDNEGNVVNSWESEYEPGQSVYLLENGHMLHCNFTKNQGFIGGGEGGGIEEYDWEGNLVWEFWYTSDTYLMHHDIEPLPNGNILALVVEKKSYEESIAAGFDPAMLQDNELFPDYVIEIEPTGPKSGQIVWEWHVWDHLVQDYDPAKANYGVVAEHQEWIDANGAGRTRAFWNHMNSIDYNAELDQILLSVRGFSEIWVIDHTTTTEESAGHSGGRYGKGGDLLYRWGNPQAYRAGDAGDQQLFDQHDAQWIPAGYPGAGNILVFNNGLGRGYSSVDEIVLPVDKEGNYALTAGSAYGPEEAIWSYRAEQPADFYSEAISGAQRLPNGNTLICDGVHGIFFEVTPAGEIVWQYVNPVVDSGPLGQGATIPLDHRGHQMNAVFKIHRYVPDYPGLANLMP